MDEMDQLKYEIFEEHADKTQTTRAWFWFAAEDDLIKVKTELIRQGWIYDPAAVEEGVPGHLDDDEYERVENLLVLAVSRKVSIKESVFDTLDATARANEGELAAWDIG